MVKKKQDYRVISQKKEYENPFMVVSKYEVEYQDGSTKPYWVLDRKGDFSIIVPIFPDNTTLLVGQWRVSSNHYSWEFPMGSVTGAIPLDTAMQELSEETGYKAKKWKNIGSFYVANGHTGQKAYVFIAKNLLMGISHPEESELLEVRRMELKSVKKMIEAGTIKDGPTIVAYHFAERFM